MIGLVSALGREAVPVPFLRQDVPAAAGAGETHPDPHG